MVPKIYSQISDESQIYVSWWNQEAQVLLFPVAFFNINTKSEQGDKTCRADNSTVLHKAFWLSTLKSNLKKRILTEAGRHQKLWLGTFKILLVSKKRYEWSPWDTCCAYPQWGHWRPRLWINNSWQHIYILRVLNHSTFQQGREERKLALLV